MVKLTGKLHGMRREYMVYQGITSSCVNNSACVKAKNGESELFRIVKSLKVNVNKDKICEASVNESLLRILNT